MKEDEVVSLISEYKLNDETEICGSGDRVFELLDRMLLTLVVNNVNCCVPLLQRKTVISNTLYNISLADRSHITQTRVRNLSVLRLATIGFFSFVGYHSFSVMYGTAVQLRSTKSIYEAITRKQHSGTTME
jgi:hypothetical protein